MHKFLTTLITLGSVAIMQATPKQQRDYLDSLANATPAQSEFADLASSMSDFPAKVHHLHKELQNISAMAANSEAWQKTNRSTLGGPANNITMQASKQLRKEEKLVHGKMQKIHDAQRLIEKNTEQANKILNDNKSERENILTTAFREIDQSLPPMTKIAHARKEAQAKAPESEPKKSKTVKTGRRKPDEQYGGQSHKKMKSSKKATPTKKDAKPKKDKKSKKNKNNEEDASSGRFW